MMLSYKTRCLLRARSLLGQLVACVGRLLWCCIRRRSSRDRSIHLFARPPTRAPWMWMRSSRRSSASTSRRAISFLRRERWGRLRVLRAPLFTWHTAPPPPPTHTHPRAPSVSHPKKHAHAAPLTKQWESAIHEFTTALKFARADRETAAVMLSNRSAALCSWCMQLRSRPAALSESRAIFAPDPMHLATLALKDAERATQLKPTWHKAYSRQVRVCVCVCVCVRVSV